MSEAMNVKCIDVNFSISIWLSERHESQAMNVKWIDVNFSISIWLITSKDTRSNEIPSVPV